MASPKPHILLVPGAWHPPSAFSPLTTYLESHDYTVHTVAHPSINATPPHKDFRADVENIRSALTSLANQNHNIVLLMHSYGGIPGSEACDGLLASQRSADGKKGGVTHLIYCTAFAAPKGVSLMEALNRTPLPWFQFENDDQKTRHEELKHTLAILPATPRETFYNAMTDDKQVEELVQSLRKQSYGPFWSPLTYPAYLFCPSTYILCGRDNAIPIQAQQGMCDGADAVPDDQRTAPKFQRVMLEEADHSPFWTAVEETGKAVRRAAGEKA